MWFLVKRVGKVYHWHHFKNLLWNQKNQPILGHNLQDPVKVRFYKEIKCGFFVLNTFPIDLGLDWPRCWLLDDESWMIFAQFFSYSFCFLVRNNFKDITQPIVWQEVGIYRHCGDFEPLVVISVSPTRLFSNTRLPGFPG